MTASDRLVKFNLFALEVETLFNMGLSPQQVCDDLQTSPETLARRLKRNGRRDLEKKFKSLVYQQRKQHRKVNP